MQIRSFNSSRPVLAAISGLGLAGTRRRGGACGIGGWVSPGPWRMKPPGPTERYWMVGPALTGGAGGAGAGLSSPSASSPSTGIGAAASSTAEMADFSLARTGFEAGSAGASGAGSVRFAVWVGAGAVAGLAATDLSSPALTGDGRDSRPRRWALPITALRLTPPSSAAISLAVAPEVQRAFNTSIRSSVQDIGNPYLSYFASLRVAVRGRSR